MWKYHPSSRKDEEESQREAEKTEFPKSGQKAGRRVLKHEGGIREWLGY